MKKGTTYYLFIALVSLLGFSCANEIKNVNEELLIKIDVNDAKTLEFPDFFNDYRLVVLETLDSSLIADITKLIITDTHIIIFDARQMRILLFDEEGHYLRQIGEKGPAPHEYSYINDIQYEASTQLIYVHERFQNKFFIYNLEGELIKKSEKCVVSFNYFFKSDSGFWVYSCFKENNPEGHNLILLDDDLQTIKAAYFPQKDFINIASGTTFTVDENENGYFFYPSSNIIYKLDKEEAIPFCTIDFGKKTMPYDYIITLDDHLEYDNLVADRKYLGDISDFKIGKDLFSFSFKETGYGIPVQSYECYYSREEQKTHVYNTAYISNARHPIPNNILVIKDGCAIYSIALSMYSDDSYSSLSQELGKNITNESNPILIFLQLKKASEKDQ